MAEEDEGYSSVTFKTKKQTHPEAPRQEKTLYDEVKVHKEATKDPNTSASKQEPAVYDEVKAQTSQQAIYATVLLPDKEAERRLRCYQWLTWSFVLLCIILLLALVGVCVYFASLLVRDAKKLNQLRTNQTSLLGENHNLTNLYNKLRSDHEDLRKDHNNLTMQLNNLMQTVTVSENTITNLTGENQKLQMEKKNLTDQIKNMEETWNDLNVSRAQWSVDAYCPIKNNVRRCTSCQDGWSVSQSSCYATYNNNDAAPANQRTWDGARGDCRGKASDLTVVADQNEKNYVSSLSPVGPGIDGYWIGLRAVEGNWKWIDGTNLTNQTWINPPVDNGQCVVSLQNKWKSVSCEDRNAWICEKKALSV